MHILFLTQIIPYPPDAGPKVKTWHVLRHLARKGHRITLASFVRPEEEKHVPAVKDFCQDVYTVPIRRSRIKDVGYWLRSNFTGRPFLIERDDLEEMRHLVEQIVVKDQVDVVHADQLTMTQFALPNSPTKNATVWNGRKGKPPYLVFDAHNAVWTIVDRMKENAPWFLKPIAGLEAERIKQYEGMVVTEFDHTLAVTAPDRLALEAAVASIPNNHDVRSHSITVVPIAVDTHDLQPIERIPDSKNILTLGTLHYPPNADGIRWFAKEVFPLINAHEPRATLTIVGKNPPADFLHLQEKYPHEIKITGYVPDLTPYFEQAAVIVIAVRAGGGMRVRILEAFARGMPVVTTTIGLEGIEALSGEEVLVGDTPEEFAQASLQVLEDPALASNLAQRGRLLAERKYDWQVALQPMDAVYE